MIFSQYGPDDFDSNVRVVSEVTEVSASRFILKDKSTIYADVFIFCTGYLYDFPFLGETSGIVNDGRNLYPLHKNFINMLHPSMAFIGMGDDISSEQYYWEVRICSCIDYSLDLKFIYIYFNVWILDIVLSETIGKQSIVITSHDRNNNATSFTKKYSTCNTYCALFKIL